MYWGVFGGVGGVLGGVFFQTIKNTHPPVLEAGFGGGLGGFWGCLGEFAGLGEVLGGCLGGHGRGLQDTKILVFLFAASGCAGPYNPPQPQLAGLGEVLEGLGRELL